MTWAIEDHVCRHCLGRVLSAGGVFRCSGCGASTEQQIWRICGCGIRPQDSDKPSGFRCVANPNPSPAMPAEVVIEFDGAVAR